MHKFAGKAIKRFDNFISKYKYAFITAFVFLAIGEVFFFSSGSDFRLLLVVVSWLLAVRAFTFSSKATFIVCLFFLTILFLLFTFFRFANATEKISILIYSLLGIGLLQQIIEGWVNEAKR